MIRVIVLTSSPHGTASLCLPELAESNQIEVASVVLAEGGPSPNRYALLRRKLAKTLKIGLLGAINGVRIRPWFQAVPTEHLEVLCKRWQIPLHRTPYINADDTIALFKASNADLGLSLGNPLISKRVFSVPRFGMINVHGERLPEYQNAQSVIWPIYNMETVTGLTIHQIDRKIDTGDILYRLEYPIEFAATLKETVTRSTRITATKTAAAVRYVCEHYSDLKARAEPQLRGKNYTTPSLREFLAMNRNNRILFKRSCSEKACRG